MSEHGDFQREQMAMDVEREREEMEQSGFEVFIEIVAWCLVVALGVGGVYLFNWVEHFFRH